MKSEMVKEMRKTVVHFVGIGGISMAALAILLKSNGAIVQGSNDVQNDMTEMLRKKKINVMIGHKESNVRNADYVVFSSAIHDDNPEIQEAKRLEIPLVKRAELLGEIAKNFESVISVAGSHGKTTCAAMISDILLFAGKKPTIHLGGKLASINSNVRVGNKKLFVTESCEYMDNFLYLQPDISVILNIDSDHLDYFGSLENVKSSFLKFANNTKLGGINVVCADDENSTELAKLSNAITFGFSKKADVYAKNIREYEPCKFSFDVVIAGFVLGKIKLNAFGRHNILNALVAAFVCTLCFVDFSDIKLALEHFSGAKRRCEELGEIGGAKFIHDYAHHPAQIHEMIGIGKKLAGETGRLIVVFEPHTFSRTKYLFDGFVSELSKADKIILSPVYSAREDASAGFSSNFLADEIKRHGKDCEVISGYENIKSELVKNVKQNDVVMILGAGSIEKLARLISQDKSTKKL